VLGANAADAVATRFRRLLDLRSDRPSVANDKPDKPLPVAVFGLIMGRRSCSGPLIGGLAETQEMLDFSASTASPPMSK
jgi:uncharacterized zinc-type alcohol dehydrogenase-like protein